MGGGADASLPATDMTTAEGTGKEEVGTWRWGTSSPTSVRSAMDPSRAEGRSWFHTHLNYTS